MVSYSDDIVKQFPPNLLHYKDYPYLTEFPKIKIYNRTSPNQSGEQRQGEYQTATLVQVSKDLGLEVVRIVTDTGKYGYSVGEKSTPNLFAEIMDSEVSGIPLFGIDWERFCHHPHKLARHRKVIFLTYAPLVSSGELRGIRKRASNDFDPQGKGGRPVDMRAFVALPYIMSQLGKPWSQIARELGEGWSDKKVKRTLLQNFNYIDSTKLPIQEGSSPTAE